MYDLELPGPDYPRVPMTRWQRFLWHVLEWWFARETAKLLSRGAVK